MKILSRFILAVMVAVTFTSCEDSESYSDLLRDQEHACNWFLSNQRVETSIPADTVFEMGKNAPFYRMDEDGSVYMQVLSMGDVNSKPQDGERVYFRFERQNINTLYRDGSAVWEGNSNNLGGTTASYFVYGNRVLESTTQYGEGIQWPLRYVGYNAEVNLVLKSLEGFTTDGTSCTPYLINIRYFKAEY